jgi:decaprenylphospho-beta-D-erythro-pentofuranosid-2-ulose 2-reductase
MTNAPADTIVAIFGATSDIAASLARRYAAERAGLLLVGRDVSELTLIAADLTVRGAAKVDVLEADFADLSTLPGLADAAWRRFGRLDIAVLAYGTLPDQFAAESAPMLAEAALRINFTSPVVLLSALAPRFEAQKSGVIAAISSVAGDRGRRSNYLYGAAKGGLQRYLEGLRHRLHKPGVSVLDVRPGFVATKMTAHLDQKGPLWTTPDKVADDIVAGIRARRAVVYTPWFWRGIMTVICAVPRALFHRTSL